MAARRKNARERPDDGRMYGMSDAGYQGKLKLLTKRQRALNDQVNADRRKNDAALFVQGTEATDNTTSQAACCKELLFLIQHHPRVKGDKKPLPIVIAVEQWSAGMMGRAAKAVNETLGYGAVYLGDCAEVVDLKLSRGRPDGASANIAQHWLRYEFPERMERGEYKDKQNARAALAQENSRANLGRQLCFVNATEVGLKNHDWLEVQHISLQCDAVMVVAVKCQAEALVKVPFLCAPEESTARPRANLNKLQRQQEGGRRLLERERKTILDIINDPVWQDKTRLRKLDRMRELVDQLEGIRRKNPAELSEGQHEMLQTARKVLEEGGPYVSDSEEDVDQEPPDGLYREDGHHWRCTEERCLCFDSTNIGSV